MIGRNYAPDFDGNHPQGVQWDSLESFWAVGAQEAVDTPALRAFFARAASAIILYMYCRHFSYLIFFIVYNMCMRHKGLVVHCRGKRKHKN